ncbi:MAG: N-acetyltransferase [Myxococcales bacterium]|nr:MAG: N-acetyltransferase [Myxococcales bacterium]
MRPVADTALLFTYGTLRLPPGGLESPAVLAWLQRTAAAVQQATGADGAWLIVAGDEAVGLLSLKGPPRDGVVEIGYGVAASRQRLGHATRAVTWLTRLTAPRGWSLTAETAADNRASQLVLERTGFRRTGEREDAEDGTRLVWRRP